MTKIGLDFISTKSTIAVHSEVRRTHIEKANLLGERLHKQVGSPRGAFSDALERGYCLKMKKIINTSLVTTVAKSSEDQLLELREYLARSEPFRKVRGELEGDWLSTGILKDKRFVSPSAVMEEFNRRQGLARPLMNHLAKLKRDGHLVAYEELLRALTSDRFVITGEEWPLDKRQNGTLVMIDPERTLDLIRWLKLFAPQIIDRHLGHFDPGMAGMIENGALIDRLDMKWFTEKVLNEQEIIGAGLRAFHLSGGGGRQPHGWDRHRYFCASILPIDFHSTEWFVEDNWHYWFRTNMCEWLRPAVPDGLGSNCYDLLANWGVAAFFPNTTQDQILGLFHRDKQARIATWSFSYPAHFRMNGYHVSMGLFPEEQFGVFKQKLPTHTSVSRQRGMGAIILERDRPTSVDNDSFGVQIYRMAKDSPNPATMRLRLHFPR